MTAHETHSGVIDNRTEPPQAETLVPESELPDNRSDTQGLFAEQELTGMRTRWTEVQAQFVDDPRECVHKADALVADVVDKITAGFTDARAALEEQWSRGQEVSTEELRIALQRYRDFFERLLAV